MDVTAAPSPYDLLTGGPVPERVPVVCSPAARPVLIVGGTAALRQGVADRLWALGLRGSEEAIALARAEIETVWRITTEGSPPGKSPQSPDREKMRDEIAYRLDLRLRGGHLALFHGESLPDQLQDWAILSRQQRVCPVVLRLTDPLVGPDAETTADVLERSTRRLPCLAASAREFVDAGSEALRAALAALGLWIPIASDLEAGIGGAPQNV